MFFKPLCFTFISVVAAGSKLFFLELSLLFFETQQHFSAYAPADTAKNEKILNFTYYHFHFTDTLMT